MSIVNLSSSDGRFGVSVAADDADLIASMLLLLEVPRQDAVRSIDCVRTRAFGRAPSRDEHHVHIVLAS